MSKTAETGKPPSAIAEGDFQDGDSAAALRAGATERDGNAPPSHLPALIEMRGLEEIAFHAVDQLEGERALHHSSAEGAGDPRADVSEMGVRRADAQLGGFCSAGLAAAALEFPAVHAREIGRMG